MTYDDMIQVMDPEGNVKEDAVAGISKDLLMRMYRLMVFTRLWNSKALSLQRQGRMGTLASLRGQEASNIGMGLALGPDDWFLPSFREHGTQLASGVSPMELYRYWAGDERGMKPPEKAKVFPICITVGSHLCHAVGIALGAKIRGERIAVLSSSGDGSTSQGDFHEALNFAGVFELPVVFAIQNNQWAISVPLVQQTASTTIAQKASAYGIHGEIVDGNDVLAVYLSVKRLLDSARSDHKPALVELVTYRMDDHTTADDASRYRTEEMVAPWRAKDPIDRMRKYLTRNHGWDDAKDSALIEECTGEIDQIVKDFEATEQPHPTEMFNYMYAEEPRNLKEQKEEVIQDLGRSAR